MERLQGFESQNLSSNWQTFKGHITESVVDFLAMTSDLIEEKTVSDDISEDALAELKSVFLEISKEVVDGDLDASIKAMMVRIISKIITAIDDYKISGSSDILSAIDMAIGKAVYNIEYRVALDKTKEGNRFREAMATTASVITVASGVAELTSGVMKLLSTTAG